MGNSSSSKTEGKSKPKPALSASATSKTHSKTKSASSTPSSSPSLFQKATVTQHACCSPTKNIWDVYDKLEHVAQGSTCDIFTVQRRRKQSSSATATTTYIVKQMIKDRVSPAVLQEMQSEIDLLQTLDHPNVVRIYETFQDTTSVYLVMEHLKGGDLLSRSCYTEPQVAKILTQMCSALAYCHANHVVHRDIKMENVIFDSQDADSDVTLIDFGLSTKYIRSPGHDKLQDKVGTMYTISPQILKGEYTEKADMWAVGVVAFILLSGKRPFEADSDKALAHVIYKGDYSMDGPEWEGVSAHAKKFVRGLLQYHCSQRLTAAEALRTPFLQKLYSQKERQPDAHTLARIQKSLVESHQDCQLRKFAMMVVAYRLPVDEIVELRQCFDDMDRNNHGTINFWEFKQALTKHSSNKPFKEKEMKELFRRLDQNQTGVINYSEFLAATIDTRQLLERDLLRAAFDKVDLDKSGYIRPEELLELFGGSVGNDCLPLQEMVEQLDQDGDGRISYDEFLKLFERCSNEGP